MLRWIVRALAIVVFAFAALVVLDYAEILVAGRAGRHRLDGRHDPGRATGTSSLRA